VKIDVLFDFLEEYKRVKVGDKIKIREKFLPPNRSILHSDFIKYIEKYGNVFVIRAIQETSRKDDALITTYETKWILTYDQISKISKRVFNWHRHRNRTQ